MEIYLPQIFGLFVSNKLKNHYDEKANLSHTAFLFDNTIGSIQL